MRIVARYDRDGNPIEDISKFVPRPSEEFLDFLNLLYAEAESRTYVRDNLFCRK